jgi:hypothetical protein
MPALSQKILVDNHVNIVLMQVEILHSYHTAIYTKLLISVFILCHLILHKNEKFDILHLNKTYTLQLLKMNEIFLE